MAPRDLLAPAIAYAREGFAVSRELELVLAAARGMFSKYDALARMLYVDGEPPRMGQVLRQPALARTLEAVAEGGRDAFYRGEAARAIARAVQAAGGYMMEDDLAGHEADVLAPLSVTYRGFTVYETPPNSQGLILLEELKIVEGYGLAAWGHLSHDAVHHMVEAKKLAFEDRLRFAGDPAFVAFEPARLLTDEWAAERRKRIDPGRASAVGVPSPANDTTSFVVADAAGNLCSFIQSLYAPFGCGIGIPELGIVMNNRMTGFSLDPASPNVLAPGKRTMHTLNTYMIFRDGRPFMIGNTPGGDYQVQTNLQVITGVLDFGLDVQAAVDAPRWGHGADGLIVEREMPVATREELSRRGHDVRVQHRATNPTGRPQAIVIDQEFGAFAGGSDSRGEGAAAGW